MFRRIGADCKLGMIGIFQYSAQHETKRIPAQYGGGASRGGAFNDNFNGGGPAGTNSGPAAAADQDQAERHGFGLDRLAKLV